MTLRDILITFCLLFPGIPSAATGIEAVYVNGKVYTSNRLALHAEAFAVSGDRFVAVGKTENIRKLAGPDTRVHDLEGRRVLPGLIDDHIHPDMAMEAFFNISVNAEATTFEEFKAKVKKFRAQNPEAPWVFGSALDYLWDDGSNIRMFDMPSHNAWLNALIPDKPAYFWEVSGHAALVNDQAFEALGITKDTPDPEGGYFVKDEHGELTGLVRETAAHLFWEEFLRNELPAERLAHEQLKPILQYLNSLGITSITDVWTRESMLKAYRVLDESKDHSMRVAAFISDPVEWTSNWLRASARRVIENPAAYQSANLRVLGVKFVLDGGAAGQTAVMTEPYEGTDHRGPWRNDPQYFMTKVLEYDKQGLTIRAHGAGDGAIRWALDAFEKTRKENGSTLRHAVAHTAILNPADIHRFAELGVIAEISPVFWYQTPAVAVIEADIGERLNWLYPARSLKDQGARMSAGSDWIVTPPNPWIALETLVTRRAPGVAKGPALIPEERISLEEAIELYTMGGAYSQYRETEIGSIEPGKLADFVVIDQDIFGIPTHQIHKTQVLSTVVGGREVYKKGDQVIDF